MLMCISVYLHHVSALPTEARRGHQIPDLRPNSDSFQFLKMTALHNCIIGEKSGFIIWHSKYFLTNGFISKSI